MFLIVIIFKQIENEFEFSRDNIMLESVGPKSSYRLFPKTPGANDSDNSCVSSSTPIIIDNTHVAVQNNPEPSSSERRRKEIEESEALAWSPYTIFSHTILVTPYTTQYIVPSTINVFDRFLLTV